MIIYVYIFFMDGCIIYPCDMWVYRIHIGLWNPNQTCFYNESTIPASGSGNDWLMAFGTVGVTAVIIRFGWQYIWDDICVYLHTHIYIYIHIMHMTMDMLYNDSSRDLMVEWRHCYGSRTARSETQRRFKFHSCDPLLLMIFVGGHTYTIQFLWGSESKQPQQKIHLA